MRRKILFVIFAGILVMSCITQEEQPIKKVKSGGHGNHEYFGEPDKLRNRLSPQCFHPESKDSDGLNL